MTTQTTSPATRCAAVIGVYPRTKRNVFQTLEDINRYCRWGELPYNYDPASYGIAWAIQTGRVSGEVERWFRALSPYRICKLVDKAAEQKLMIGDAPAFLVKESGVA